MRFEKWQALGNDYLIAEERELPFALTPERVRRLCAPHTGVGSDGVLLIRETDEPGQVAEVRIYNPDGSEAELSGNGVRQAVMYLRRSGWVDEDSFSVLTAAGPIRPRIEGELCTLDMGHARDGGTARWSRPGASSPTGSCRWATRSARSRCPRAWRSSTWVATGHRSSGTSCFPTAPTCPSGAAVGDAAIRARIFERGVGETMSSGTGASGAAVAAVLRGVTSPVTVALDGGELGVEVGEDLRVTLTGWARPVYAGTLSDELIEELHEAE